MRIRIFVIILILISATSMFAQKRAKDFLLEGAPEMVLITGTDSLEPFLVSRTEVTNREYLTYLTWLRLAYFDYPEVILKALPHTDSCYTFNPLYRNYPVTGITWEQADAYCHWLSDRYHEYELIKNECLYFDFNQVNEETFNTEAYLANNYHGMVKNLTIDPKTFETRQLTWTDSFFYPTFRLPTEMEYDRMAKEASSSKKDGIVSSGKIPYKKHFLNTWSDFYLENTDLHGPEQEREMPFYFYTGKAPKFKNYEMKFLDKPLNLADVYKDAGNKTITGLKENAAEWLLEPFCTARNNSGLLSIYDENGQPVVTGYDYYSDDDFYRDSIPQKDSLGRMSYFYGCIDQNGKPVAINRFNFSDNQSPFDRLYVGEEGRQKLSGRYGFLPWLGFRVAMSARKIPKF